jgi:uncharacterized protein YaaW (UPF0174 family)
MNNLTQSDLLLEQVKRYIEIILSRPQSITFRELWYDLRIHRKLKKKSLYKLKQELKLSRKFPQE